jgi:ATP-binding cassette subfamily C protein CydD
VVALALLGTLATIVFAFELSGFVTGRAEANLWLALSAGVVKAMTIFGQELIAAKAASKVKLELRFKLFEKISSSSRDWRNSQNISELNLLLTSGLDALDAYFAKYLPQLIYTALAMPIYLATVWTQDSISGITIAVTLPLIPIFMIFIGWATTAVQTQQLTALTKLSRHFAETVRGLTTLRVFGRANRQIEVLKGLGDSHRRRTMKVLSLSFVSGFALELIASLSVALIAVSIGLRLLSGDITLAIGLFVLLLAPDVYLPLRQVGANFHASADGVAALNRTFEIFDSIELAPKAEPMFVPLEGKINVLTGPSGMGKTTALRTLDSAKAAWMPQYPSILPGTVRDNIVGPNAGLFDALAFAQAIKLSALDDFDLDRAVGSLQSGLSGGQLQRLMLARAIYHLLSGNRKLLLLDEPTSAQDAQRIKSILNGLRHLADSGNTIVIVSHQRFVIDFADQEFEVVDA